MSAAQRALRTSPDAGTRAALRRPELRRGILIQLAVQLVLLVVWGIVHEDEGEEFSALALCVGAATALPAGVGAVIAARRGPGRTDAGARLLRTAGTLAALGVVALAQIPLLLLAAAIHFPLFFVVLGSMSGLVAVGVGGAFGLALVAISLLGWTDAPPGTGLAGRCASAGLALGVVLLVLGLGLGSSVQPGTNRDFVSLVVALAGREGEVVSPAWLWLGRAGAVVVALALALVVRTFRGTGPYRQSSASGRSK